MPIRFYDHNEVTYSPHFVAQDSNKEKMHNGRSYKKIGVVKESRSFVWSIGQFFKGFSFGVIGVVALPLSLCCRRATSRSCFKSFVRSLNNAWRREETVKVYILKRQPFFQSPSVSQPPVNSIPDLRRPQQNSTFTPQAPTSELPRPTQPLQDSTQPSQDSTQLSFAPGEQNVESVMKVLRKRFTQAKELHEHDNFEELDEFMRETFELVNEWIMDDLTDLDRQLAYARLLSELGDGKLINPCMARDVYLKIIEDNPENLAIKKEYVVYATKIGEIRACHSLIEELLENEPDNVEMRINYANCLFSGYDIREAAQQYSQVLTSHPDCVDALIGLAKCLMNQYEKDQACELLEKALKIAPENGTVQFEYARILLEMNREDEAVGQFQKALELEPCNEEIRTTYVRVLKDLGSADEIVRICEDGFALSSDATDCEEIYCEVLFEQRQLEKLARYCQQRLENQSENVIGIRKIYIRLLTEQGNNEEEILRQFSAILEKDPNDIEAITFYFKLLGLLGRVEEIRLCYQQLVERGINRIDLDVVYAKSLQALGLLNEAENIFSSILKQVSSYYRPRFERDYFEVLEQLGKTDIIESYIMSNIQKNPKEFRSYRLLAEFLQKQHKVDQAIQVLETFLGESPDHVEASNAHLQLLQSGGNNDAIRQSFETYLERKPSDVQKRRQFGQWLKGLNELEGAAEQYAMALELEFSEYQFRIFADVLRQAGKAEEIPLFYERALEKSPNNDHIRRCYAKHLVNTRKFQEAAEQYEELLKSVNGEWQTMVKHEFAELLNELGRKDEAADQYGQVLNADPANFYASREYVQLLTDLNRSDEIEPCYKLLIESGHNRLREEYALWLKKQNRAADAAEQFRLYLKTEPYYFNSKPYVEVLEILNLHDEVEQYFKQRIEKADSPLDARLEYASHLREQNRFVEAEEQLLTCIKSDSTSSYVRNQYINILLEQKKLDQLKQFYLETIETLQGEEDETLEFHRSYIYFLRDQNQLEEAIQESRKLVMLYPMQSEAWALLKMSFRDAGSMQDLEKLYLAAIDKNPGNSAARLSYVDYLKEEKKKTEAALQCKDILRLEPENIYARLTYIQLLNSEGRYNEAIVVGQEGVEGKDLNSRDWHSQNLRAAYAEALSVEGLKDKAIEQYRILVDQGRSTYQWHLNNLLS